MPPERGAHVDAWLLSVLSIRFSLGSAQEQDPGHEWDKSEQSTPRESFPKRLNAVLATELGRGPDRHDAHDGRDYQQDEGGDSHQERDYPCCP
jgi:hypothetical protein